MEVISADQITPDDVIDAAATLREELTKSLLESFKDGELVEIAASAM